MSATNKVGTNSAETINADSNDIFLWGENGSDTINGNGLDNTIGGGNDSGADTLNGGNGDDVLLIQRGSDALNGGGDYDIARLADYEVIDTGFFVGPFFQVTDRNGFEIASTLVGNPLNKSVISLGIGSNAMRVGQFSFIDSSVGFGGVSGSNSAADISLGSIDTSRGVMTVTGIEEFQLRDADDVFFGNELSHTIDGRGGNDFIDGGDGADKIIGGSGTDTVSYQRSDAAVSVILSITGLQSGGHAENDTIFEVENLIGSSFGDFLSGTGDANRIEGQNGDDTLRGQSGDDQLFGGNGADTLNGDAGFDILTGGSENDTLLGGTAADILNGDAGTDTASYIFSSGAITLTRLLSDPAVGKAFEHVGADTTTATAVVNGTASIDTLNSIENIIASNFSDRIAGGEDNNRLEGRNGDDVLRGNGGIDTLLGGNQNDELHGDGDADILDGGADNDDLFGGSGNDSLRGGTGLDNLDGESDIDTAEYSEKTSQVATDLNGSFQVNLTVNGVIEDTLRNIENVNGGSAGDILFGDNFNNVFNGNGGSDLLRGEGGQDTLDGGTNIDTADYTDKTQVVSVQLNGANNATVFVNSVAEDTIRNIENLIGGSNNDILFGDSGNNRIEGAGGGDKIAGEGGEDTLIGGSDTDVIDGGNQNDRVEGGDGNDSLGGGADNDQLFGDADDDLLNGGLGLDELDGGTGNDIASYVEKTDRVVVHLAGANNSDITVGGILEDVVRNVEGVIGGSADDQFFGDTLDNTFDGRDGDDVFFADAGADKYDGSFGTDMAIYLSSSAGVNINLLTGATGIGGDAAGDVLTDIENLSGSIFRDILVGSNEANRIFGNDGNDSIRGEGSDDVIFGGVGGDSINGGAGSDTASYADSSAGVNVNLLANTFSGGDAAGDALFFIENLDGSGSFRDILVGNDIGNTIRGLGGNDSIRGEGGNDTLEGGLGADGINGGGGIDTVSYESSAFAVNVDLRVALQVASLGDSAGDVLNFIENIKGSAENDDLAGSNTANTIEGGAGKDHIDGHLGNDRLIGGEQADVFIYNEAGWGFDQILDYEDGSDHISITTLLANDVSDFTITGNGTSTVTLRLNGVASSTIILTGTPVITVDADDFFFTF